MLLNSEILKLGFTNKFWDFMNNMKSGYKNAACVLLGVITSKKSQGSFE
jgi:hypothetical protein